MAWSDEARAAAIAARRAKSGSKGGTAKAAARAVPAGIRTRQRKRWVVAKPGGGTQVIEGATKAEAAAAAYRSMGYGVKVDEKTGRITRDVPVAKGSQTAREHLGTIGGTPVGEPRAAPKRRRSAPRKRSELEKPFAQRDPAKMMAQIQATLKRAGGKKR